MDKLYYSFKTLRKINGGDFCKYTNGDIYLCNIPDLLSKTATMLELINYANKFDNAVHIRWLDHELVDVEVIVHRPEEKSKKRKWKDHGGETENKS